MQFRVKERRNLDLNITPLVDVVFLLLIFFMVTTTFAQVSGIKLDLPEAQTGKVDPQPKQVVITIDWEGQFFVNQELVASDQLRKRMLNAIQGNPNQELLIQADRQVAHEKVVLALDVARQLGLYKLAIATLHDGQKGSP